jgi:thiosulfate/3-mercaptopyruvate sulfurtransferase
MRYQFVDCRYELGDPGGGRELYLEGHVPGASFLSVEDDLSDMSRAPEAGRHPLPAAESFAAAASLAGIGPDVFVVAYDQGMTGGAARLWWLLRHFGHDDVAVLNGGLGAWKGPLRSGEEKIVPQMFVPRPRADDTIEAEELLARLDDRRLIVVDARVPERFRGDVETLDPVAGHIPGAANLPYTEAGSISEEVLRAEEIAVYCGSGVTACVDLLALHEAGRPDARLYAGSWSEWSRRGLRAERA